MLHQTKNFIKSNKLTRKIYEKLQCFAVFLQYKMIQLYYRFKPLNQVNINSHRIRKKGKIKIFYFGGDELQDKSGFLQALASYAKVTYFTKEDGSYGSYNYGVINRKKNIKKNGDRLLHLLRNLDSPPDILLMQTWEWRIGLETLHKIRKLFPKINIVNIAMDDKHSFWIYGNRKIGSAGLIPELDFVFTTSSEAVEWYRKEGCKAYFYPLASDEHIFKPLKIEKIYDVGFVGAKYGIREKIVERLRKEKINVKAYGKGWEDGRLPIEDTNKFYNQCRIVLGVGTILGCNHFTAMKLRDFDVPMSGSVYITTYNNDTAKIFHDKKEILFYNNIEDCVRIIKSLLTNENEMKEIRNNALRKALQHTYTVRVKKMLENMGYEI